MRRKLLKVFGWFWLVLVVLLVGGWLAFVPWSKEPGFEFLMAWGEKGSGPGQFNDPTGIAVAGSEVFVSDARNRVVEYLLTAYRRRQQPSTENFMLLVPEGGLNPTVVLRWQLYLEQASQQRHPVWNAWHAFVDLLEDEFAKKSPAVTEQLLNDPDQPLNPLVRREFAKGPPSTMREVAQRYGRLLGQMDQRWQKKLRLAMFLDDTWNPVPCTERGHGEKWTLYFPAAIDEGRASA